MISGYGYSRLMPRVQRVPGEAPLPYVQSGKRTLIFSTVTLFHAAMLILPVVFLAISEKINPPVFVTKLPIVDSEPNDNEIMSPYPDARRKTPDGVPDKGEPDPDLPPIEQFEPIKDLPKLPDPPKEQKAEPQPQPPAPAPQPQPKETAKPEKRPVEKVPETVKQTPVENGKGKTPAKTDSKPKKKYLSADDIKISRKVVHRNTSRKNTGNSAAVSANARAEAARNARNAALAQRLRNLSQYGVAGGQGTPGGGGGRNGVVSKEINDYYNKTEAFLKRRWNQPRLVRKTANLKAVVAIQVDARGRILSARIIQSSGVSAMDASVRELLASLSTLPVPPKAMAFTVDMEIDR